MTRVVIFNDSPTLRALLRACLEASGDFEVAAEAADGRDAAELVVESRPDLVLMDVMMPGVDGYAATQAIMARRPTPIVMVTSVEDPKAEEVVFRALAAGALYITSPPPNGDPGAFLQLLRAMAAAQPSGAAPEPSRAPPPVADHRELALDVIGMAASAGGPEALSRVLSSLPTHTMPPILVVQHLSRGFGASFVSWLGKQTGHRVEVASHGVAAAVGVVYVAPDDRHLGYDRGRLELSSSPAIARFRPSATYLLRSLASAGSRAAGVVLTGMGTDGAEGAVALRQAGGYVVAQSRESAAVWGMPGAVAKAKAADAILPVGAIAARLIQRSGL